MSKLKSILLASISTLPLTGAAFILTPSQAIALAECTGGAPPLGTIVICTGGAGAYPTGILYAPAPTEDLTIVLGNPSMTVGGQVRLDGTSTGNLSIDAAAFDSIIASAAGAQTASLYVRNLGTGDTAITVEGGNIVWNGPAPTSAAVLTYSVGGGASQITLNDATITTTAANTYGAYARSDRSATITMNGGTINTAGRGLYVAPNIVNGLADNSITINNGIVHAALEGARAGSGADATVTMNSGSIDTSGVNGIGLHSVTAIGEALVVMQAGSVITQGAGSNGLYAQVNGTQTGNTLAQMQGGSVTSQGDNSSGPEPGRQWCGGSRDERRRRVGPGQQFRRPSCESDYGHI